MISLDRRILIDLEPWDMLWDGSRPSRLQGMLCPLRCASTGCGALSRPPCDLVMSGAGVATQRAFIMAAVALCAIMIDRAAVTMRGLAVAATIILVFRPESWQRR